MALTLETLNQGLSADFDDQGDADADADDWGSRQTYYNNRSSKLLWNLPAPGRLEYQSATEARYNAHRGQYARAGTLDYANDLDVEDIDGATYSIDPTDNLLSATGTDSGGAMGASTQYYVYLGNDQATYAPSDIRASTTAPSRYKGILHLGTSGNAARWRFIGWIRTDGSSQFTAAEIVSYDNPIDLSDRFSGIDLGRVRQANFVHTDEQTISGGVITVTDSVHTVDTQSDAATDDLDTINGFEDGQVLFLSPAHDARSVVLKHGTGNIKCFGNADITLDDIHDTVILIYNAAAGEWWAITGGGGGGGGTPGGADTQVQFNDSGSFGGDADFTWDKTTNELEFSTDAKVKFGGSNWHERYGSVSTGHYSIQIDANNNQSDEKFAIYSNSSTLEGGTELFRVQGNGRVGLSESSPQNLLDASGAAVIGSSYSGVETAPSNGLLVEGLGVFGGTASDGISNLTATGTVDTAFDAYRRSNTAGSEVFMDFSLQDSISGHVPYARLVGKIDVNTTTSEEGELIARVKTAGSFIDSFGINAYGICIGGGQADMISGADNTLMFKESSAPPSSAAAANQAVMWVEDADGDALTNTPHFWPESGDDRHIVMGTMIKTDTGDPTQAIEGQWVINTFDNTLSIYADGAWQSVFGW